MGQDARDEVDGSTDDGGSLGVPDDQLPEDLRPGDDNPLARPAGDDVPDDILTQGVGHDDSGESPEDVSASGYDGAGTPSSGETSSGAGSNDSADAAD